MTGKPKFGFSIHFFIDHSPHTFQQIRQDFPEKEHHFLGSLGMDARLERKGCSTLYLILQYTILGTFFLYINRLFCIFPCAFSYIILNLCASVGLGVNSWNSALNYKFVFGLTWFHFMFIPSWKEKSWVLYLLQAHSCRKRKLQLFCLI